MKHIFYSLPAFAFAIPTFPVMVFLPALYSENFGLSISYIGVVLFIAKIFDIITDPVMGWLNDKRIMSRKFWIIFGALLSGLSLHKLFQLESLPYNEYLFIWIVLLYVGWTMFQIPYLSIGYEIEDNYHDRTKLSATREFFVLLGLFCSLSIPMIVELENKELVKSLVNLALISGFIGLAIFLFFVRTTKPKVGDKLSIKTILNLKNNSKIRKLFLIWFLNSLANVFPMILFVFFITYVLGGNDGNRQETLFYYFLFSVIGIPIWTLLSKKTNKVFTWRVSLILSAVIFSLVLFLESGNFAYFIIISCLTGLCLGADLLIPLSIQADMIDFHRMKFKEDISGFIFSVITFLNKISFAIASIFVFGILGMLDFDSDTGINPQSKYFIIFSYAVIPIILKLTASHLLKRLNFTENELISIQKEINM